MDSCITDSCIAAVVGPRGLKKPPDGDVLAPFVEVSFSIGGTESVAITVGNNSSAALEGTEKNHASIKSFQFGFSTGQGCTVEILDEQGGNFDNFIDKLIKTIEKPSASKLMIVRFGWIITDCNGSVRIDSSEKFYFAPQNVTSTNTHGIIKFTIEGVDIMHSIISENREETVQGVEDEKKPLKLAIRHLFDPPDNPTGIKVDFWKSNSPPEGPIEYKFNIGPFEGPYDVWRPQQENKLAVAQQWLSPFRSEDDKGIVPQWDANNPTGHLIFWDSPAPPCNGSIDFDTTNYANYIVNGGKCSPVISFEPQIKWNFQANAGSGGNIGGANTAEQEKMEGEEGCDRDVVGTQTQLNVTENATAIYGPRVAQHENKKSEIMHEKAHKRYFSIEAELRIVGDPYMARPRFMYGKTIGIAYINPFHIRSSDQNSCGDWTVEPTCNPVLTNKGWWIHGVDHSIKEGSYITTIKLRLLTPNTDLDRNAPLGGWSGAPSY